MHISKEIFEAFLKSPDWSDEKTLNIFNKLQSDFEDDKKRIIDENKKLQETVNVLKGVTETCLVNTFMKPTKKKKKNPKKLSVMVPNKKNGDWKEPLQNLFDYVNFEIFNTNNFEDSYKKIVIKYHEVNKNIGQHVNESDTKKIMNTIVSIENRKTYSKGMWDIYNVLNKNLFHKYL